MVTQEEKEEAKKVCATGPGVATNPANPVEWCYKHDESAGRVGYCKEGLKEVRER